MVEGLWLLLALILPWLSGVLWLRLAWPSPAPGHWAMALGYGYLLGLTGITLVLRLQGALGLPLDAGIVLALSALLALVAGFLIWRRARPGKPLSYPDTGPRPPHWAGAWFQSMPPWQRLAFTLLILWLAIRLMDLALAIWWQPLYPWDAWTTWSLRARIWTELQELVPFVAPDLWLDEPRQPHYALPAWSYPTTVSLIAAWPPLVLGVWNEAAANLPWLGAGLALGLGFYGQARLWGAPPLTALIFVWLLLSLPILDTQIALAGYADLWQALALGFTFMAFLQWCRNGDRRQAVLALLCLLIGLSIKREGLIWAMLFLPALLVARWRRSGWLLAAMAVTGVIFTTWWTWGGPGLAVSDPDTSGMKPDLIPPPELIPLPGLGDFQIAYHDVWGAVLRHSFLYGNWHLLPYLVVLALLAGGWAIWRHPNLAWQRAGLAWVLSGLTVIYILFFWTQAYLWAEQATSINRVVLHIIPGLVFWTMTLWGGLRRIENR